MSMTIFNENDAFTLTQLAQYRRLSQTLKETLLRELSEDFARETGRLIVDPTATGSDPAKEAASAFRTWAETNQKSVKSRHEPSRRKLAKVS
jgi:hypothetical protein